MDAMTREEQEAHVAKRPWLKKRQDGEARWDPLNPKAFKVCGREVVPEPYSPRTGIDPFLVKLLQEEPFYAAISTHVQKVMTDSVPTMGVTFFDGSFHMLVNPTFVKNLADKGRADDIISVLKHEFNHVFLNHVTSRHSGRIGLDRVTSDLANNSLLVHDQGCHLPYAPFVPGLRPGTSFDQKVDPHTEEQDKRLAQEPSDFEKAVMNAPPLMSVEGYVSLLSPHWTDELENKYGGGSGGPGEDDHGLWIGEKGTGEENEAIMTAKKILARAARVAEEKGWGKCSARTQQLVRSLLTSEVDWREEFAQWNGMNFQSTQKSRTRRRVDRRYPYQVPGTKRNRGIRAALCLDESGSVSDAMLSELAAEINAMTDVASVTVIPFDYAVDEDNVVDWQPGDNFQLKRTCSGGTNFDAPTAYVNDPSRSHTFDVVWMLTDGECSKPRPSVQPRCWLLPSGCKLYFETEEKVIVLKKGNAGENG